jgi:hypothetical protein
MGKIYSEKTGCSKFKVTSIHLFTVIYYILTVKPLLN